MIYRGWHAIKQRNQTKPNRIIKVEEEKYEGKFEKKYQTKIKSYIVDEALNLFLFVFFLGGVQF